MGAVPVVDGRAEKVRRNNDHDSRDPTPDGGAAEGENCKHLKRVEWLVGTWAGKGESAQGAFKIAYSFDWALNKNFLVKTVTARAMDHVVWSATEWIGWDVDRKKVVSIGFGRDGSLFQRTAADTKEKDTLILDGPQGARRVRHRIRRTNDALSVLIERQDEGRWVTDRKIEAKPAK